MEELLEVVRSLKKKMVPETDGLNMELLKCASQKLTDVLRFH
jgi:hypothetical protein